MSTLQELAKELNRQTESKHDYVADTRKLSMATVADGGVSMTINLPQGAATLGATELFHEQLGTHLNIPKPYYSRMRKEAPGLLADNVNLWLNKNHSTRMVRTLDNNARAFLSSKYRPLDNIDIMTAMAPSLFESNLEVKNCDLTPTRMYIKAVSPRATGEVKKGDPVQAGIILSNSEVGGGALSVQPFLYRLACLNGAVMEDQAMRRIHAGTTYRGEGDSWELLSSDTRRQSDKALFMQAADLVKAFVTPDFFNGILEKLRLAAEDSMGKDIPAVVTRIAEGYNLNDTESQNVLKHLLEGTDYSRWGMINAITAAAKDSESYDRCIEMEKLGGKVIELARSDWSELVAA